MTESILSYYVKYTHSWIYLPKNFLKPLDFFLVSGDGSRAPSWDFRGGTPAKSRCSVPLRSVSAVNIIKYTLTRPDHPAHLRSASDRTTTTEKPLKLLHPCKRVYYNTTKLTSTIRKALKSMRRDSDSQLFL